VQGWIGVDLDGTIARYDGWRGELHIGDPIPTMVERVKRWLAAGYQVKIFTARVAEPNPDDRAQVVKCVEDWCEAHIGVRLEVTNVKDYHMIELWDDRVVQVYPNTGTAIGVSPRGLV
jgi:hypothetical protein